MHIDALIHTFRPLDIVDILVVAVGIYYLYKMQLSGNTPQIRNLPE